MKRCMKKKAYLVFTLLMSVFITVLAGCGGGGGGSWTDPGSATVTPVVPPVVSPTTPPAITATTPADGDTLVPITTTVTATFNKPMNGTTINLGTFTVQALPAAAIGGTFAYNSVTNTVTFTPTSALANDTLYTVTVTSGVMDASAVPMALATPATLPKPNPWTFRTEPVVIPPAAGPPLINLLSISTNNFVVLSKTAITDTGSHTSAITGNIGLSPATAAAIGVFCSEMTGNIYGADAAYVGSGATGCFKGLAADNTTVGTAVLDMGTAYTAASAPATPAATDAAHLNVGTGTPGTLNGQVFPPGIYTWGSDVNITGNITLTGNANDVWIFQMSGNLNLAPGGSLPTGIKVLLGGAAQAKNIFWQVGGGTGATLGTYSTFNGTILSASQVVMQTGSVLNGRALAQTQVTLDVSTVGP